MARPKKTRKPKTAPRRAKATRASFPLSDEFVFDAARVVDLHKIPGSKGTRLELVLRGKLTPAMADLLGCRGVVFTDANNARGGYRRVALDIAKITQVRLKSTMGYRGRTPLDVMPKMLNAFTIANTAGFPELLFRAVFDAYSEQLSDFTDEVGDGLFAVLVMPVQQQMFDQAASPAPPPAPPTDAVVQ